MEEDLLGGGGPARGGRGDDGWDAVVILHFPVFFSAVISLSSWKDPGQTGRWDCFFLTLAQVGQRGGG